MLKQRRRSQTSRRDSRVGDRRKRSTPAGRRRVYAARLPDRNAALSELFVAHGSRVVAYFAKVVDSSDEAEDLSQETFLRVWRQMAAGRVHDPENYLWTAVKTRALNARRDRKEVRSLEEVSEEGLVDRRAEPADDGMCSWMRGDALIAAMRKLNADQFAAYQLVDFRGLEEAEAARLLGVKRSTLSMRRQSARRSLAADYRLADTC